MFDTTWPTGPTGRQPREGAVGNGDAAGTGALAAALTPSVLRSVLAAVDTLVILGASYLAFLVWLQGAPYADWAPYALVTLLGALLAFNGFAVLRLYNVEMLTRPGTSLVRVAGGCALVAATLIAISYATKTSADFSRVWGGLWFLLALVGLLINRAVFLAMAQRGRLREALCKRIAVVGETEHVERLLDQFQLGGSPWVRVIRAFAADQPGEIDLNGLEQCIRTNEVDTVVVAIPWIEEDWALKMLGNLYQFPVDVLLSPRGIGLSLVRPQVHYLSDVPMLTLADRPLLGWRYVVKVIEDRILASLILLLIAPLLLTIAVLIKLDSPGPVLFRQKRFGFNNQLIEVWKFRTMYQDRSDPNAEQLTQRADPRVTKLGRFLRASSLDELPQFFNVLRGDMSIVGPRPHAIAAKAAGIRYQEAVREYAARHRVKPGITGWAQVNGWRGETETVEQIRRRVHHDIAYIDDWSLWLDLKIILMTVFTGFIGKNAY